MASPLNPVNLFHGNANTVLTGGTSVVAIHALLAGGVIWNPLNASDQGLAVAEKLYVSEVGPAGLIANQTTFALLPGQFYFGTPNSNNSVWVNAPTGGHKFTSIIWQSAPVPQVFTPLVGIFPPLGPSGLTTSLPSYLYQQYTDDDDLQAFVLAYNSYAEEFVDWFNSINLPIYTQSQIFGPLLDWVAEGIYGILRPVLSSGLFREIGPYNTQYFNQKNPYNGFKIIGSSNVAATSDDVFKRIITWHFYKGDGKYFSALWLKRRIMRFLFGVNGVDFEGPTYPISVTFGVSQQLNITIINGFRTITQAGVYNPVPGHAYNDHFGPYNSVKSTFVSQTIPILSTIFKEAVDTGALEFPFQFSPVIVRIYAKGEFAI
jgi:hypothetical protein